MSAIDRTLALVERTLATSADPGRMHEAVRAALPEAGRVELNLFCGPEHPRRALCLIDLVGMAADEAARRLGGEPFGFSAVVLAVDLPRSFTCRVRRDGNPPQGNCSCSSGPLVPPLLGADA